MKKFIFIYILILCCYFFGVEKVFAIDIVTDPYCPSYVSGFELINNEPLRQSFKPKHNTLNNVGITTTSTDNFTLSLLDENQQVIASKNTHAIVPQANVYIDFTPFQVTVGKTYYIQASADANPGTNGWAKPSNDDAYTDGTSFRGSTPLNNDLGFVIFASDVDYPTSTTTSSASATTSETISASTTTANSQSSTTSQASTSSGAVAQNNNSNPSLINAPTNLKVSTETVDNKLVARLNWDKSSTDDIDGYKIYRKKEGDKLFSFLATTKKDVLTYDDKTVEQGKTYQYFVYAYKGSAESSNTETITIKIENPASTLTTTMTTSTTPAAITTTTASSSTTTAVAKTTTLPSKNTKNNNNVIIWAIIIVFLVVSGLGAYLYRKGKLEFLKSFFNRQAN